MATQGDAPICISGLKVVHDVVRLLLVVVVHQVEVVLGGRSAVYAWVPGQSRPGRSELQLRHRQEQEQVQPGALRVRFMTQQRGVKSLTSNTCITPQPEGLR